MRTFAITYTRDDDRGQFNEYLNSATGWKSLNGGYMKQGAVMGNHYHARCETLLFILSGKAEVTARNIQDESGAVQRAVLNAGEGAVFEPYETHAFLYLEPSTFLLFKSEVFLPDDQDTFEAMVEV
jgi:dTDP-4-dehydrorhamnose 3,5-epimerase-like enzyme